MQGAKTRKIKRWGYWGKSFPLDLNIICRCHYTRVWIAKKYKITIQWCQAIPLVFQQHNLFKEWHSFTVEQLVSTLMMSTFNCVLKHDSEPPGIFLQFWILHRLWNSIFFWVWKNRWFYIVILILGANLPELSFDEKQISLEAAPLSAKWVLEGFVFLLQNFSRHIIQQMEEKKLTTHSHVGKRKLERITFRPILKKLEMKFCVSIEFSLLKIWNWRKRNCRRRLKYSEPCHILRDSF